MSSAFEIVETRCATIRTAASRVYGPSAARSRASVPRSRAEHASPRAWSVQLGAAAQRARDRGPLALATRHVGAALLDPRVGATGHRLDEVLRLRDFERGPHLLFGGARLAELQVAGDGAREEVRALRDVAD